MIRNLYKSGGRLRRLSTVAMAGLLVAMTLSAIAPSAGAAVGPSRIDLRVLVLSNGDATTEALAAAMDAEGVPYTKVMLNQAGRPTIDAAFLSDTVGGVPRAKFEAVIAPNDNPFASGSSEMSALADYERTFAIRQVDTFTFPSAAVGLTTTGGFEGSLDGMTAQVTAAGAPGPFSYLRGTVPIDNYDPAVSESYGYLAIPAPGPAQTFTPLVDVAVPGSTARGSIIGAFTADGREQMVMTIVANPFQTYFRALTHGIITWATKGIHLGHSRNYFTVQVDDILAADSQWSIPDNCTPGEDCPATVTTPDLRMTPADVDALVAWQNQHGFKLVMAYNAEESVSRIADNGSDALTAAFLANKDQFPWLNHTYSHEFLSCTKVFATPPPAGNPTGEGAAALPWTCLTDASGSIIWVTKDVIEGEINNNIAWAQANGVPINPTELLTGEHSGLFYLPQVPTDNPNFVAAINELGIKSTGADASRDPDSRAVGGAMTFPRHPMALWFNVATKAAEVDEYNWIYNTRANGGGGFCEDHPDISTCIAPLDPATGFDSYILPTETRFDLMNIITNDARPHYVHQPNLTEDRLLYPVLDSILGEFNSLFADNAPIVQPSVTDLTTVLSNQQQWKTAQNNVSAYLLNGQVTVQSTDGAAHAVPLTVPTGTKVSTAAGADFGESYAGERSAWTTIGAAPVTVVPPGAWDNRAASQTTVTSSLNPSAVGQAVTFTATVAPVAPATGVPTGTIQFRLDGAPLGSPVLLDGTGAASLATSAIPAGSHTIDAVYLGDGAFAGSVSTALSQVANPLAITALSPNSLPQGAASQLVTITGTGFLFPPALAISGTGVTVDFVSWNSTTQLTAGITVTPTATLGARDVTVTNPGGATATVTSGLTVTPAVTLTALTPSSLLQGATSQLVTIAGSGFLSPPALSFSGTGVTVDFVSWNSATQLTASVTVAPTATPGARDVTVTNPGGTTATLTNGFTVTPIVPAVTVATLTPNNLARGVTNRAVVITGTGFVAGSTVTFSGTGVTATSVTFNSATQLTAQVTTTATAAPGLRDVTVKLPNGLTGTLVNGFTVTGPPAVTSVSPNTIGEGATTAVTITGSNFVNGATVVVSGAGVTVGPVTWNSATSLTASLTATSTAAATARNVTVTNPDTRNGRCTSCLTVTATPVMTAVTPASLQAGQANQAIRIDGSGFTTAALAGGVAISFGSDVTLLSLTRNSNTHLTARVTVAATATPGPRDVQLTVTGQPPSTLAGGFTVTAPLGVTGLSPTTMRRGGAAQTLTVNGSGFVAGTRITVSGGAVTVGTVTVASATQLQVPLTFTTRATLGNRTVTIILPNGLRATATLQVTA